jgi:hypothetical protein
LDFTECGSAGKTYFKNLYDQHDKKAKNILKQPVKCRLFIPDTLLASAESAETVAG